MSENDRYVPLFVYHFHTNEVRRAHLVFQKKRFQGFISEILRVVGLLREKFIFFYWENQNLQEPWTSGLY